MSDSETMTDAGSIGDGTVAGPLPRALVFDCDGVLVDSMGMWLQVYPDLVARYGIEMTPEDFRATEHMAMPDEVAYYHRKLGIGESAEALLEELRSMIRAAYERDIPARPGAREVLEQARELGVPCIIATSTEEDLVLAALARLGMDGFFRGIVTTKMAGASKESPAVYDLALSRVAPGAAPADAWVFEDAPFGLASARGAGYHTVGIYDAHGRAHRADVEALAEVFVETLEGFDLVRVVGGRF